MIYRDALKQRLPRAAERYSSDSLCRMVLLCRQLQHVAGDEPFYLTCRTAGDLLGISYKLANKWTRLLAHDRVLELVERGKVGRASRYRYLGD